ncbi:unnamed protein product [Adineta ricciae]|uniref:Amino acid permease/ SLC12A domain-containing protein n=1 Tax=Adineta ricciae TaxID=249248 RepID=A0A815KVR3_ADIRI|nr:unnamed protein product [Adineta ricciae]CAF1396163.1 unnamed protein product [Adineta ricciae]
MKTHSSSINSLNKNGIPISVISSGSPMNVNDETSVNDVQFNQNSSQRSFLKKLIPNFLRKNSSSDDADNPYANEYADTQVLVQGEKVDLHRNLQERHMIMIALGGTIGTGLFLASGQALASAGPGGSLVSYLIISVMVYFVMTSLAELATQYPISGSFNTFGSRFVDEAFGFALAYNYYFSWVTTIAGELVAAGLIVQYWLPHFPSIVWSILGMLVMFLLNAFTVKGYGEAEYWFAMIKVITVLVFLLVGVLVDSGAIGKPRETIGFKNWKIEGAPFVGGVAGVITTSIISGFAFQGTEAVGIAAGESSNPKKDVPRAMNGTIWRIILFFVGAIFIMGLIIPYNDKKLSQINGVDSIAVSPFTLVFSLSGIPGADHIMNVVILTTILSAGNSGLYLCTRIFWTLANEGKAPKIFRRLTKGGIPIYCLILTTVLATSLFGLSFVGNQVIYIWLVNMTSVMGFIAWFGIAIAHWRFRRAFLAQGYSLNDLVYKALFFPVGPFLASLLILLCVFGQGYSAFTQKTFNCTQLHEEETYLFEFNNQYLIDSGNSTTCTKTVFNVQTFLSGYVILPILVIMFFVYKYVKKTKFIPLKDIDLLTDSVMERDRLKRERIQQLQQTDA